MISLCSGESMLQALPQHHTLVLLLQRDLGIVRCILDGLSRLLVQFLIRLLPECRQRMNRAMASIQVDTTLFVPRTCQPGATRPEHVTDQVFGYRRIPPRDASTNRYTRARDAGRTAPASRADRLWRSCRSGLHPRSPGSRSTVRLTGLVARGLDGGSQTRGQEFSQRGFRHIKIPYRQPPLACRHRRVMARWPEPPTLKCP